MPVLVHDPQAQRRGHELTVARAVTSGAREGCHHHDDGRIDVVDRPVPEPVDDQVLVRVHGAGLNRADLLQRAGHYPAPPGSPPDIPGLEFAGVVEAIGPTVDRRGDRRPRVRHRRRRRAGRVRRVPAAHCAPVPDGLDLVAMGGAPEAFVTAHDALVTRAGLAAGEWVLVHAVGSGVGTAALQLATGARRARRRHRADARQARTLPRARARRTRSCRPTRPTASSTSTRSRGPSSRPPTAASHVTLDLVGGDYVRPTSPRPR